MSGRNVAPGPAGSSPAGRIGIVGAGILGVRIARELVGPGADGAATNGGVQLVTRRSDRRDQLTSSFGESLGVVLAEHGHPSLLEGTSVVIVSRESAAHVEEVRHHVRLGRHVVSTADDPEVVGELLELRSDAVAKGVRVVLGAAMSPGLSCLLARHAASELHRVDEIHVARQGAAGPACARQRLRALRGSGVDWRDGEWLRRPGFSGRELCWFPDPVAARDCYRAALPEPVLLVPSFPGVQRVTSRLAATRRDRALAPFPVLLPPPSEGGLGAIRVELRGELDGERASVIYGALDRPAVAAAGVAAVVALRLLVEPGAPGVGGVASLEDPLGLLRELARRGVRAARFEGAGSADPVENLAESVQFTAGPAEEPHAE